MMKKLMILLALLIAAIGLNAQGTTIYRAGMAPTHIIDVDTITDTGTDTATVLVKLPQNEGVAVQVMVAAANISGTTDIDVDYQASMDNSSFYTLASDSLATGNLTYLWSSQTSYPNGFPGRYFKILGTGVGTQSSTWDVYIYVFKIPGQ